MSRAQSIDDRMLSATAAPVRQTGLVLYATVCTVVVAVILLTNWPTYGYSVRGGFLPLYYYVIPGVLLVPILFAHPEVPLRLLREPLAWWFVAYVAVGLLWQLVAQDFSDEPNQQLRVRILMFFIFGTSAVLCAASQRSTVAVVVILCVLLSGACSWFDALRPFRFMPQGYEESAEGRGAGLFINPNIAGAFVVMGTIVVLPYIPMRFRAIALTAAVMCLAPTFSRGAFVVVAFAALTAIVLRLVGRVQALLMLVTLPLLIAGVNVGYDYLMTHSEDRNMQRVVQRLMIFTDGAAGDEDQSVDLRTDATARAFELFKQSPLYGAGLGTTTSRGFVTGPHNMYVALMAEHGIFGLGLYLSLLGLLVLAGWRLVRFPTTQRSADIGRSMIVLAVYFGVHGFFSHNVLDEAHGMFLLGFVVAGGIQERMAAPWAVPETAPRPQQARRPAARALRW